MINLFEEFDPVSGEEWLKKATADLKGEDPFKKFKKELSAGIFQLPYYDRSDIDTIETVNISHLLPDREYNAWWNTERIPVTSEKEANILAIKALNSGSTGLHFINEVAAPDLDILLRDIELSYCYVSFENFDRESVLSYAQNHSSRKEENTYNLSIITNGNQSPAREDIFKNSKTGTFRDISLHITENQSDSLIKNLAGQLSLFVDIVCQSDDENVQKFYDRLVIVNQCQQNYFLEIAKLRALRILFARAGAHFGLRNPKIFIQSITTISNDPLENLLINTTQTMSAICGGTDAMIVCPHIIDPKHAEEADFARRIARNVSNLLDEESHLGKVKDPSAGSYYLCSLTNQIVEKVWAKFNEIEELGGFTKLQEKIA